MEKSKSFDTIPILRSLSLSVLGQKPQIKSDWGFGFFVKRSIPNKSNPEFDIISYLVIPSWLSDFIIAQCNKLKSSKLKYICGRYLQNIVSDLLKIPQIKNIRKISTLFRLITTTSWHASRIEMDLGFDRIQSILRIESSVAFWIAGLNPEKPEKISSIWTHNWEHWSDCHGVERLEF